MPKRTFQPNRRSRSKTHGFRSRMKTKSGAAVLSRRVPNGTWAEILSLACGGRYVDAARLLMDVGTPTLAARTHLFAAGSARNEGRDDDARRHAAEALRFYSHVGAPRFAEWANALLRR